MTILQEIIAYKKQEVLNFRKSCDFEKLKNSIKNLPPAKSFLKSLEEYRQNKQVAVIAEVKKASPSKGVIREDFNHIEIARVYEKAGAAAMSILTDEKFFQGNPEYLCDIRKISSLPLLRKDFIIDEIQVYQTRQMGADIILLIASALDKKQLRDYFDLSKNLGLDVLLEVHTHEELDFALDTGARIIGINNRDLKTFNVDLRNTTDLIKGKNLDNVFIISESGIKTSSDVKFLKKHGISGILIGEALMKEKNVGTAFNNLIK